MTQEHSLARASGSGLFLVGSIILAGALQACRPEEQAPAGSEDTSEAEHAEEAGGQGVHWAYEGETGTDRWGELDPAFEVCASGVQQSPVDLAAAVPGDANGLDIQWQPAEGHVVDNGHTIQVNTPEAGGIVLEGREFSLLQFHFHLPSEHTAEGVHSPMEVHFVHQAAEGDLAVIGVFMNVGEADPVVQDIWDAIPDPDASPAPIADLDARGFLPEGSGYLRYAGSLTTPPCSEIVSWVVMTAPVSVSQAQVDAFAARYSMNARPVQPLHGRVIRSLQ
jgi:carbonic anhydrase